MQNYYKCAGYACFKIFKKCGKLIRRFWIVIIFIIVIWILRSLNLKINFKTPSRVPVIVYWTGGDPNQKTVTCRNSIQCKVLNSHSSDNAGAYVFYASKIKFDDLPLPRRPDKIVWAFMHEESPRNEPLFMHERALSIFNFSSTFSRHSNVPFPLQFVRKFEYITSKEFFVETSEKNSLLRDISPVLFLQSDCDTITDRDLYVKELMAFINVDSYGKCLHNKDLPLEMRLDYLNALFNDESLRFISKYKFIIAIENGICFDYVTEKFWRAIFAGTVPIYFGSPTIRDWMPNNKSAILLEDFPTPRLMSEHLKKLMGDDKLYEEYLEHKIKGIVRNERISKELKLRPYQNNYIEIHKEFMCFLCENLHRTVIEPNIVNKSHYDCPKPLSAVNITENDKNEWTFIWEFSKVSADRLFDTVNAAG